MKRARWISAAISTAVLTAGLVLPAIAAFADSPSGNGNAGVLSLLSGNDVTAPVSAPVNVCGVAVALPADRTPAARAARAATRSLTARTTATATRASSRPGRATS